MRRCGHEILKDLGIENFEFEKTAFSVTRLPLVERLKCSYICFVIVLVIVRPFFKKR